MRRWQRWTLRRRLVLGSAAILITVLAVSLAGFGLALDRILTVTAQSAAATQAAELTDRLKDEADDPAEIVETTGTSGALLQVVDSANDVVGASERSIADRSLLDEPLPPGSAVTLEPPAGTPEYERFVLAARGVTAAHGRNLTVVVALPLRLGAAVVRQFLLSLTIGAGVLLVALLALVSRLVTSALAPVETVRADVAAISRRNLAARVTVPPGDDEIAALAGTMNEMLARLERGDRTARQFASDASHELRSPLATIRTTLEVAGPQLSEDERSTVYTEVLRMQRLVDDLLTLAKADDDALPLHVADVDLDEIVAAEARRLRAMGRVAVDVHLVPARVRGDEGRLAQVVRNLTDNAARHAAGRVALTLQEAPDGFTLAVDDDGPPVAPADRERIFDRFARLEESRARDTGGSGLGLAIARMIAQRHGGTLVVSERPDGWCRFVLQLPRPAEEAPSPLTSR